MIYSHLFKGECMFYLILLVVLSYLIPFCFNELITPFNIIAIAVAIVAAWKVSVMYESLRKKSSDKTK